MHVRRAAGAIAGTLLATIALLTGFLATAGTAQAATALSIATTSLPAGTLSHAYSSKVTATGGTSPYTYTATGLPTGLALSSAGALTGTPTVPGSFTSTFTVKDHAAKTASKALKITVSPATYKELAAFPSGSDTFNGVACPSTTTCFAVQDLGANGILSTTNGGATWIPAKAAASNDQVVLRGIACPSTTTCVAVGSSADSSGTTTGTDFTTTNGGTTWVAHTAGSGIYDLDSVACPTTTTCVAVGSLGGEDTGATGAAILTSADGGATWTARSAPAGPTELQSVACPSTTTCTAAGYHQDANYNLTPALVTTTNLGTWTAETAPAGATNLTGIACPTTTVCTAVGYSYDPATEVEVGVIDHTVNGGAAWTTSQTPSDVSAANAVTCPSATACTVAGAYYPPGTAQSTPPGNGRILTTTDGSTWTEATVPAAVAGLSGVACPSVTACTAVGYQNPKPTGSGGPTIIATTNGTWTVQTIPLGLLSVNRVTCPSTTLCLATSDTSSAGPTIERSTNGGTTWSTATIPGGVDSLSGIVCPSTTACHAVGFAWNSTTGQNVGLVLVSTDGGLTWTAQTVPGSASTLAAVSCPSTTSCTAVGQTSSGAGTAVTTTDGGSTWTARTLPATIGFLAGVSCPSTTTCTAVGSAYQSGAGAIAATTNGGATWTAQTNLPAYSAGFSGVSCPSTTTCVASGTYYSGKAAGSDGEVAATTNSGATWTARTLPTGVNELGDVACASTTVCTAVGNSANQTTGAETGLIVATGNATTWSLQTSPADVTQLNGVSCPSTTVCRAGGYGGVYGGTAFIGD